MRTHARQTAARFGSLARLVASVALGPAVLGATLDELLAEVHPEVRKWATVVEVTGAEEHPRFVWHHFGDSERAVDFWPASTIKLYTVVAALEYLNELGMPTDSTLTFFARDEDGAWRPACARGVREMISEVFRRSSNEDYTLLLRFVGIDRINTHLLTPERGFLRSALMRDYVTHRPVVYENEEPQRIAVTAPDGHRVVVEHTWSGVSYAERRGATVLSSTTGNCTSTRDLAECLRRLLLHESLPATERYNLTPEQVRFVREGATGFTGLRNRSAGPYAWEGAGETVFPNASFYHKAGLISDYVLDAAYLDDPDSGKQLILALAAHTGHATVIRDMARLICEAVKDGSLGTPRGPLPEGFVDLQEAVAGIDVDPRYATTNNFLGVRVDGYRRSRLILTRHAASRLRAVQADLAPFGLGLRVFDAYRPQRSVDHFVRWAQDPDENSGKARYYPRENKADLIPKGYVADRSSHSRGSTLDATLIDQATGEPLDMGTEFDFFDEASRTDYPSLTAVQRANRLLLKSLMAKHGFRDYPMEWWHFTLADEPFPDTVFDFPID